MFYIKTDEYGSSYVDIKTVRQMLEGLKKALPEGVTTVCITDKVYIDSVKKSDEAIKNIGKLYFCYQRGSG